MSIMPISEDAMTRMLKTELHHRICDEETKAASRRIAQRINADLDKIVLSVLAEFDMRMNGSSLVITVKKVAER
jgi:hypothetical protein